MDGTMGFEVSWVQDDQQVWHQSPHAAGYIEDTSPWIFTAACGRHIETATPPLPLQSAPASGSTMHRMRGIRRQRALRGQLSG